MHGIHVRLYRYVRTHVIMHANMYSKQSSCGNILKHSLVHADKIWKLTAVKYTFLAVVHDQ